MERKHQNLQQHQFQYNYQPQPQPQYNYQQHQPQYNYQQQYQPSYNEQILNNNSNNFNFSPRRPFPPFRIPIDGMILEITGRQLLDYQGDIRQAADELPLRLPYDEEKNWRRVQFRWKGYTLIATEEELLQSGGNLDELHMIIEGSQDAARRLIPPRKRRHEEYEVVYQPKQNSNQNEVNFNSGYKRTRVNDMPLTRSDQKVYFPSGFAKPSSFPKGGNPQ